MSDINDFDGSIDPAEAPPGPPEAAPIPAELEPTGDGGSGEPAGHDSSDGGGADPEHTDDLAAVSQLLERDLADPEPTWGTDPRVEPVDEGLRVLFAATPGPESEVADLMARVLDQLGVDER